MVKKTIKWFTLVELIIVITILSILATIWFVSYNGHLITVRDTNRISQLAAIHDWLEVYRTKNDLPLPENSVEVRAWTTAVVGYQWYMWKNNLETIAYNKWGIDPKDQTYFTYYVSKDRKYFQLMAFLEDQANKQVVKAWINQANAVDYSIRYPTVYWKKLGILTDLTNTPIQEIATIKTATYLDLVWTTAQYNAIYSDNNKITWTWVALSATIYNASCKRIKEVWWNQWNWVYTINPSWTAEVQAYCDMSTDWGWWTLVWRSVLSWTAWTFWFKSSRWNVLDDTAPYSLGQSSLQFSEILFWTYSTWKDFWTDAFKNVWTFADDTAVSMTTTKVLGSCTEPFSNIAYAWHKSLTTNFFLSDSATSSATLWLLPSWFTTTSWCPGWNLNWLQWMVFVR